MKRYLYFLLIIMGTTILQSCAQDDFYSNRPGDYIRVNLSVTGQEPVRTKSLMSEEAETEMSKINNVWFFIFDANGDLVGDKPVYVDGTDRTSVELKIGYTYQGYAITNTGSPTLFESIQTKEDLELLMYSISSMDYWEDLVSLNPFVMSGYAEIRISSGQNEYPIEVERLCAKIEVSIVVEKEVSDLGYEITEISLHNIPSTVAYCKEEVSEADIQVAVPGFFEESGERASRKFLFSPGNNIDFGFYMLENRAGGRLEHAPDCTVPAEDHEDGNWDEQAGKRHYAPDDAAYLLIKGKLDTNLQGVEILTEHYVYLGHDHIGDYNVGRNEYHKYTIKLYDFDEGKVRLDSRVELSMDRSAAGEEDPSNCFIIPEIGNWTISAMYMGTNKGNDYLISSLANKDNLEVDWLWSDVPDAITNLSYDKDEETISFILRRDPNSTSGKEPFRGNTVIALYDKTTKKIMWSWHLWLTENPEEIETGGSCVGDGNGFYPPAKNNNLLVMDRNLGAISADPGDGWKTFGCYYQGGRKDPFPGTYKNPNEYTFFEEATAPDDQTFKTFTEYETTPFKDAKSYTDYLLSNDFQQRFPVWNDITFSDREFSYKETGMTVRESINYPTLFGGGSDNKNCWLLFNNESLYLHPADKSKYWQRQPSNGSERGVTDPCPRGWSMIGNQQSSPFVQINERQEQYIDVVTGVYGERTQKTGKNTVWWPAAGFRNIYGKLSNLGISGVYAALDDVKGAEINKVGSVAIMGGYFDKNSPDIFTLNDGFNNKTILTNHSASVRCVKGQK